jgi:predicted Rossmann-fold nucleotide-binding protein
MHFAMRANALAAFPGGFGTLDEVFEILTLKQARRASGMPIVLFCRDYWENVVDFYALAELSMISQADLALFQIVESAEEGWEALLDRGLTISTPLKEK